MKGLKEQLHNQDAAILLARYKLYFEYERLVKVNINDSHIDSIFTDIDEVVQQCSNERVQRCRRAIISCFGVELKHVFDYLLVVSKNQVRRRKRLYVLYVINDVLHHTKQQGCIIKTDCTSVLSSLFQVAWECPSNRERLQVLLQIWRNRQYLESSVLDSIWNCRKNDLSFSSNEKGLSLGSAGQPYYLMPASLMISHIKEGFLPIDPGSIECMTDVSITPEVALAVEGFEEDLEKLDWQPSLNKYDDCLSYYGWSREFIDMYKDLQPDVHQPSPEKMTYVQPTRLNAYPPPTSYD
jgi:hypothetical protein